MAEAGTPKFEGFNKSDVQDGGELNYRLGLRNLNRMEQAMDLLIKRVDSLEENNETMRKEIIELKSGLKAAEKVNDMLQKENEELKKQLNQEIREVKKSSDVVQQTVKAVEDNQSAWIKRSEGNEESLRKIIEQQQQEKKEITEKVINVIKEKKKLVRDTVDKVKCVMVFGVAEEKVLNKNERESKEKEKIKNILEAVTEEGNQAMNMVEEFHRIGKFEEQRDRPLKIKFATQVQAEEVLSGSWRLSGKEEFKNVWINRDLDEEERNKVKELVKEAKQKNDMRTEEEKEKFYWKVRDLRVRKVFIRK